LDNHQGYDPDHRLGSPQRAASGAPDDEAREPSALGPWLMRNGPYLLILAAAVLFLHYYFHVSADDIWTGVIVVLGLGSIIFIHELGHFLVAKWCDVHVQTFSIGFGPALPGCRFRRGETTYMIALFPLGGYVKMVGEGPDSEENEDDPRSFKNKPVWQRMAIISAGVTMNLIFGFAAFVFVYMTHGEERQPATVGHVEPGSPAWRKGVQDGHVIYQIGDEHRPYFDSLMTVVMDSREDEALPFVYGRPGAPPVETTIVPARENEQLRPMIGIAPPPELLLPPPRDRRNHQLPVQYNSAAAKAEPPFEFGDRIVATTDPDHPTRVTDLRDDPRHPGWPDYFQFKRRMQRLAGQPVVIRVRRGGGEGQPTRTQDIKVPPASHYTFGLRMRMGRVMAIRTDSPAQDRVQKFDIIERVEVNDPRQKGLRIRYVLSLSPKAGVPKDVTEKLLDPVRLPFELEQWARAEGADGRVTLRLLRKNPPPDDSANPDHKEDQHVDVVLRWDSRWQFDDAKPFAPTAPLPIAGLGLAYQVETRVADVVPGSPADRAGIQKDDLITAYRFHAAGAETPQEDDEGKPSKWFDIKPEHPDQWAFLFQFLQYVAEIKRITVRLEREDKEITLVAEQDKAWPLPLNDQALRLESDTRLVKADSFGQALGMGVHRTYDFVRQIFGNLRGVVTGRLSHKNFGGPVMIAKVAFFSAAEDMYKFLIFLAIISVNLAVINFLPIPVLDGGHMVFLIYEAVFRRPAPEKVLTYALIVGLTLLFSLMLFVTYLDLGGR